MDSFSKNMKSNFTYILYFDNVYYNVIFARVPLGTKVEGYLVHYRHKNPRLQILNKLFNGVGKESISVIVAS
jgi:hypothetical protein